MAFNIVKSTSGRRVFAVVFAALCFYVPIGSVYAAERDASAISASGHITPCPKPPGIPSNSIFRDLEGINFYVDLPLRLETALQCHGNEIQCAHSNKDIIERLEDDYDAFPVQLRPENLTSLFVTQLNKSVLPFVRRDEQCRSPAVRLLTRQSLNAVNDKDTLTVTVKVTVDDFNKLSQPINNAIVSVHLFRPDLGYSDYWSQVSRGGVPDGSRSIEFDNSSQELQSRIEYILKLSPIMHVRIQE